MECMREIYKTGTTDYISVDGLQRKHTTNNGETTMKQKRETGQTRKNKRKVTQIRKKEKKLGNK